MKRRIVRITAGTLIVLAWLAAGVYAFWGGKEPTEKQPAASADEMSKQIAQANVKPAAAKPAAKPGAFSPSATAKPAVDPLFTKSSVTSGSSFKPRAGAFPPATTPAEEAGPRSKYEAPAVAESAPRPRFGGAAVASVGDEDDPAGAAVKELGDAAKAAVDAATDAVSEEVGSKNPLRGAARGFAGAQVAAPEAETDAAATENSAPYTPPPSRFGAAPPSVAEEGTSVPRPSTNIGARRFNSGPPSNELPAETAPSGVPDDTGYGAASTPAPRGFAGASARPGATLPDETQEPENVIASARPGAREFEGSQAPSLVIEKLAPQEIQVGKLAKFEIHVRNVGQTTAQQVIVTDHVPAGTQFVDAKPAPQQAADGSLVWDLGKLEPNGNKTITLELMPEKEGEIGSVAQVTFSAAAAVKTVSTRPQLAVEHVAPAKVMIGDTVTLQITISNPGTGAATNVVLQEDVPEGLAHSAGKELEYEVGTLRPGESRKLELQLEAAKAGIVQNTLVVRGDANLTAQHTSKIEVIAPQLAVEMNGPKRRYLDRQATYTVSIANPGTAAARDVEIVAYLPKGMKFVSTDKQGQYDPQNHAVYWSLEELPAAQQGSAQLVAIPIEPGEQKLRVEGHAQQNLKSEDEETILVEAISQLVFEIIDEADPIEVGADTVYQIRVTNEGSKTATNVQVAAALPAELRPGKADGATKGEVQGQTVIFEPLGKLAPQAEATFKISATGLRTGDFNIRVQITSDDMQTPVTKEEPTRVYEDR